MFRLTILLLISSTSSLCLADNYFVVGSYAKRSAAQVLKQKLYDRYGVEVLQQEILVNGSTRFRLLIDSRHFNEDVAASIAKIGITPWRITLTDKTGSALPTSPNDLKPRRKLVGVYSDIDIALSVERDLANQNRTVSGNTKLKDGSIMHEVWVEVDQANLPTDSQSQPSQNQSEQRIGYGSEQEVARDQNKAKLPAEKSAGRYPTDFNLARLPPKPED